MDFTHTDDRRMLADTLGRFIADTANPLQRAAAAKIAPGYDAAQWGRFAELGAIGAFR